MVHMPPLLSVSLWRFIHVVGCIDTQPPSCWVLFCGVGVPRFVFNHSSPKDVWAVCSFWQGDQGESGPRENGERDPTKPKQTNQETKKWERENKQGCTESEDGENDGGRVGAGNGGWWKWLLQEGPSGMKRELQRVEGHKIYNHAPIDSLFAVRLIFSDKQELSRWTLLLLGRGSTGPACTCLRHAPSFALAHALLQTHSFACVHTRPAPV